MSFFPICLFLIEEEKSLLVTNAPKQIADPFTDTSSLTELLRLLQRIETAAKQNYSLLMISTNFSSSESFPHHLRSNLSINSPSEKYQYLIALTSYIHNYAKTHFPALFETEDSSGTIACRTLQHSLHQLLSISLEKKIPEIQANSSTIFAPFSSISSIPMATTSHSPAQKRAAIDEKEHPLPKKYKKALQERSQLDQEKTSSALLSTSSPIFTLLTDIDIRPSSSDESDCEILPESTPAPLTTFIRSLPKKPLAEKQTEECQQESTYEQTDTIPSSSLEASPSTSLLYKFLLIKIDEKATSVTFIPANKMSYCLRFSQFIKNVQKALTYSSYTCQKHVPELISQTVTNDQRLLLQALYACVLRNIYFWHTSVQEMPISLKAEINATLNSINQLYYEKFSVEQSSTDLKIHPDLKRYDITSSNIPEPISSSVPYLTWISIYSGSISHQFFIRSTLFYPSFSKGSYNGLIKGLQKNLTHYNFIKTRKNVTIKCLDGSCVLYHPQNQVITQKDAISILSQISQKNAQHLQKFYTQITADKSIKFTQTKTEILNHKVEQFTKFLHSWEQELAQEKLPSASIKPLQKEKAASATISEDVESPTHEKIFFTIQYNPIHNNFLISQNKYAPSPSNCSKFLAEVAKSISSKSYSSLISSPELTYPCSTTPTEILQTLFFLVCRYTFTFREKNKNNKRFPCIISQEMTDQTEMVLRTINQAYRQATNDNDPNPSTPYHPDLMPIANRYTIWLFTPNADSFPSFDYRRILISFNPNIVSIEQKKIFASRDGKIVVILSEKLASVYDGIIKLLSLPKTSYFIMQSTDPSYPLDGCGNTGSIKVDRYTLLIHYQRILTELQQQILSHPSCQKCVKLKSYKTLQDYLQILSHVNKALTKAPILIAELPPVSSLTISLSLVKIVRLKEILTIKTQALSSLLRWKNTAPFESISQKTYEWLFAFFKTVSQNPPKIKYESKSSKTLVSVTDLITFLPFLYRGLEQNLLQIRQAFKQLYIATQTPSTHAHCLKAIDFTKKSLTIVKDYWKILTDNQTELPSINELLPEFKEVLYLTQEQMHEIHQDLGNYISSFPEDKIPQELALTEDEIDEDEVIPFSKIPTTHLSRKRKMSKDSDISKELAPTSPKIPSLENTQFTQEPSVLSLSLMEERLPKVGEELCPSESEEETEKEASSITAFTPATTFIVPLPATKKSPSQGPLPKSSYLTSIQQEKPLKSTSSDLATTSESLPSTFILNYLTLKLDTTTLSVTFCPARTLNTAHAMYSFLNTVETATTFSSYQSKDPVPEFKSQSINNNRLLLLQALYATVIRNFYFWSKTRTTISIGLQKRRHTVLSFINTLYHKLSSSEEISTPTHIHEDLSSYEISPLHIPLPIKSSSPRLFWTAIHPVLTHSNKFAVRTTCCHPRDVFQRTFILCYDNMIKSLECYKKMKTDSEVFIKCLDGSFLLPHAQNSPIDKRKILPLLENISKMNKRQLADFCKYLESSDEKQRCQHHIEKIKKQLSIFKTFLQNWRKELSLQAKSPISQPISRGSLESTEKSTTPSSHKQPKRQSTKSLFLIIKYQPKHNTFIIDECMSESSNKHCLPFLNEVEKSLLSNSYTSKVSSSDLKSHSSNNRKEVLKTLFFLVCKYTFVFRKKNTSSAHVPCISVDLVTKVNLLLTEINALYCQEIGKCTSTPCLPYHKELLKIADRYEMSLFTPNESSFLSFNFCHIVFIKPNTISLKNQKIIALSPSKILLTLSDYLKNSIITVETLLQTSETTSFLMNSTDPSYLLEGADDNGSLIVTRNKALEYFKQIFSSLNQNITSAPIFLNTQHLSGYIKVTKQLLITQKIDTILAGDPISITTSSSILRPTMTLSLFRLIRTGNVLIFKHDLSSPLLFWKNTQPLRNTSERTFQWLSAAFITPSVPPKKLKYETPSKELIKVQNLVSFLPFIYRGLQQNLLQIQRIFKDLSTKKPLATPPSHCEIAADFTKKSLLLISNHWKKISEEQISLPSLDNLADDLNNNLPFTSQDIVSIRREIETYIQTLQENQIPSVLLPFEDDNDTNDDS